MGKRGPAREPTKLRVIRGNPSKRPLPKDEPKFDKPDKCPSPPAIVKGSARSEWKRVAPKLHAAGLLNEVARAALAAYCQAWGRWIEAEENLRKFGIIIKSPKGYPIQSPYLSIANKSMEQMRRLMTEFGMTPASAASAYADPNRADKINDPLHGID